MEFKVKKVQMRCGISGCNKANSKYVKPALRATVYSISKPGSYGSIIACEDCLRGMVTALDKYIEAENLPTAIPKPTDISEKIFNGTDEVKHETRPPVKKQHKNGKK